MGRVSGLVGSLQANVLKRRRKGVAMARKTA